MKIFIEESVCNNTNTEYEYDFTEDEMKELCEFQYKEFNSIEDFKKVVFQNPDLIKEFLENKNVEPKDVFHYEDYQIDADLEE